MSLVDDLRSVRPRVVAAVLGVLAVELLVLFLFVRSNGLDVLEPRYLLYPLVWMNAAALAVASIRPPARSLRVRAVAGVVASLYFVVLLVLDGSLGPAAGAGVGIDVVMLPPGWGPAVVGSVAGLGLSLIPFKIVGYAALAYLLYNVLLDAVRNAFGGVVGLFACVGCAAPGIAGVVAAVLGGSAGAGVIRVATTFAYDLSTAVFLLALGVLVLRPFSSSLRPVRNPPRTGEEP